MKKFFKNRCVFGLIILVVIISVVIGVVNATNSDVTFTENVVQIVMTPIQKFFTNIGNGVSGFFKYFSDIDDMNAEIEALKNENAQLKTDLDKNESKSLENEELRRLLAMKEAYPELELEAAEIVGRDPSNWYNTFTIDKGAVDGVLVNQAVISVNKSLVGRKSEVGTTWARVVTINKPGNAAGAEVVRSGEYGVIEGNPSNLNDGNCILSLLSKNANIIVGDKIVTSGRGGIYPKGLTVGKVVEIRPDVQGISQYAVVTPEADVDKLKAVMIIKNDMDHMSE